MMPKPRRFNLDLALDNPSNPIAGDVLVSTRAVYRITDVRPVDSRVWANRWKLTVQRIGDATNGEPNSWPTLGEGNRRWDSVPYRRGETPQSVFGEAA